MLIFIGFLSGEVEERVGYRFRNKEINLSYKYKFMSY